MAEGPEDRRASAAASVGFGTALRRADPLAWCGLAAAVVLVAFPGYYALASLVPLFAGGAPGYAGDFVYYHRAGVRFAADPLTLYADPSFLYPPPAGALFALVARLPLAWGYALVGALTLAALVACLRIVEALLPARLDGWARAAWWAVGLTAGPALQNVKFGQVNVFVLLTALVFVQALAGPRVRPGRLSIAGAWLGAGVWLKLYPVVLTLLALRRRTWPALVGFGAVLCAVPLVLGAVVPAALYAEFASTVLPGLSGDAATASLNAGLPAIVERLRLPPEALLSYVTVPFGPAAGVAASAAMGGGTAAIGLAWVRGWPTAWAALALLALIPVASTFGWEYTFVLALPAVLVLLPSVRAGPLGVRLLAITSGLAWLTQKPPEAAVAWAVVHVPEVVAEAFAARLVLALVALSVAAWWTCRMARNLPGTPGSKTGSPTPCAMRTALFALFLGLALPLAACADSATEEAYEEGAPAGDREDVIGDGEIIDEPGEPDAGVIGDGVTDPAMDGSSAAGDTTGMGM